MKKALITGITGQDGSYLVEFLLKKGYQIWGIIRRSSSFHTGRIDHLYKDPHEATRLRLVYGDLTDGRNLYAIINDIQPDPDVSKAKKYFGFEAKTGFDEGLKATIDWYRKHQPA